MKPISLRNAIATAQAALSPEATVGAIYSRVTVTAVPSQKSALGNKFGHADDTYAASDAARAKAGLPLAKSPMETA